MAKVNKQHVVFTEGSMFFNKTYQAIREFILFPFRRTGNHSLLADQAQRRRAVLEQLEANMKARDELLREGLKSGPKTGKIK